MAAPTYDTTRAAGDASRAGGANQPAPPILQYAPAFVVLLAVLADAVQYADTDLWGHVRFGQIMLATHRVLRHDLFSYSAPGASWVNHEWLAEVVMALFYNALGVAGLKLMKFLCAGAIVVTLAAAVGETGAAAAIQFAVLIAAAAGLQVQVQFRPQLFDYIFLAALLALLGRWRRGRRARLWLVVLPMMVVWGNLHGGFFIGVVVLGVYAAALGAQDLWEGRGPGRALRLAALATCAALVTLLNPYGVGLWRIVAHTLRNPYTMGVGAEFQTFLSVLRGLYRAGAPTLPLLFALAVMGALPVSFALAPSADDLPELTVAAMMVALALYSARNSAFAMIACASPIALHCDLALTRLRRGRPAATAQSKLTGETAQAKAVSAADPPAPAAIRAVPGVQIAALAAAVALALNAGIFSSRLPAYTGYPVGAVGFMERHALSGRILNRFIWGSYIFWHLGPRSRVFIDGRFEMVYPLKVQADYLDFLRGGTRAARVLAGYPHDFVMVGTDTPPCRFMTEQPGWRLIYRDPVAALFARADTPAARIAGNPEIRATAPPSMFP